MASPKQYKPELPVMGRVAGFAFIALMTGVIAACGVGTSTSSGDPTAALQIYSQKDPGFEGLLRSQIADFQNQHKTIKVNIVHYETEKLRAQFQNAASAHGGPELVYGPNDNLGPWVRAKVIQPIDTLMGPSFIQQFADNAVGSMTYGGHVYAAPDINGGHLMLLYNRKIATEPAMSHVTGFIWPPDNTDDLIKASEGFTDKSKNQYGLVFSENDPLWLAPWIGGFGGSVLDAKSKPTLNTQSMIDALAFELSLKTHGAMPPPGSADEADMLFRAGQAAFIIDGDWSLKRYRDSLGSNFGIAPLPLVRKTARWPAPYTAASGYSVNVYARGDNLRAARIFLQYISQAGQNVNVATLGAIPANRAAIKDPRVKNDPILGASSAALIHGVPLPIAPQMGAIWDSMKGPLADVMNGTEDPAAAASAMQLDALRRLSQLN